MKNNKRTHFTTEEDEFLKNNYLSIPNRQLAEIMGRSRSGIRSRMMFLGLSLPDSIKAERAKMSWFKPGQTPVNKGKKLMDYVSPEAIERMKATQFKKGNLPHTCYHEIGKITVRKDKRGTPYQFICLEYGKWIALHTYRWEQVNGKMPSGYCIWFKDGNSMNAELDNLELITRSENMKRNSASINLPDKIVASYIAKQGQSVDRELRDELLNHPELIQAKRTTILINRKLNSLING